MLVAQLIDDQGKHVGAVTHMPDMVTIVCRRVDDEWEPIYGLVPVIERGGKDKHTMKRIELPVCFELDEPAREALESAWQAEQEDER